MKALQSLPPLHTQAPAPACSFFLPMKAASEDRVSRVSYGYIAEAIVLGPQGQGTRESEAAGQMQDPDLEETGGEG